MYGGTITRKFLVGHISVIAIKLRSPLAAYDLKLVIDKDLVDVLKPRWIINSIEAGYALPMTEKYVCSL